MRAVHPLSRVASMSKLAECSRAASTSSATHSSWPFSAARIVGVHPAESATSSVGLALWSSSSNATLPTCPASAAMLSAVHLLLLSCATPALAEEARGW